jgi:hypothetical protein
MTLSAFTNGTAVPAFTGSRKVNRPTINTATY